jgi:hypothetical protein
VLQEVEHMVSLWGRGSAIYDGTDPAGNLARLLGQLHRAPAPGPPDPVASGQLDPVAHGPPGPLAHSR